MTVHFAGSVQGVGFRFTTCRAAEDFRVTGFVRNLGDGRVELVAEGDDGELDRFLAAVEAAMRGNIRQRNVQKSPASGSFNDFRVAY